MVLMARRLGTLTCVAGLSSLLGAGLAVAAPAVPTACDGASPPAYCAAVRGDRSEGWRAQSRSEVLATHAMVAASQPLAAQAGLEIMRRGGNAIDAAVATAAVLNVVEPMMTGMGGDLFAIVYVAREHKLYALNASGMAPSGASLEHLRELGFGADPKNPGPGSGMPEFGILPVTVPGAVWGWDALLKRFGTREFREVLEPARRYAQDGFPVSERIASDWLLPDAVRDAHGNLKPDPDSVRAWYIDGRPPRTGELFRNPDLARTFQLLQQQGSAAFYRGPVARAIIAKSTALGGTMTLDDLASYRGQWREPARVDYHGYEIYELPPPSQDWATLEMLRLLDTCLPTWAPGQTLASLGPVSPLYWHLLVEAKKLAYADLFRYNADPDFVPVPLEQLLSADHARSLCSEVDPHSASALAPAGTGRGAGGGGHGRARNGRRARQHGLVGQQQLRRIRFRPHRARLWLHPAQPRRSVLARPCKSQCHRASQASVQHALGRLRHARRGTLHDGHADGRGHAGPGARTDPDRHHRPGRQCAGRERHGALPSRPGGSHAAAGIRVVRSGRCRIGGHGSRCPSR